MNLYVIFTLRSVLVFVHTDECMYEWEIQVNLDAQMFLSTRSVKGT